MMSINTLLLSFFFLELEISELKTKFFAKIKINKEERRAMMRDRRVCDVTYCRRWSNPHLKRLRESKAKETIVRKRQIRDERGK